MTKTKTNSKGTLTRREREKAAHRRDILEAAERVFASKGFEGATMELIARESEFSVGALYNFFASKEVLWEEVITRIGEDFVETFRAETRTARGPLEAIVTMIRLRLTHVQQHVAFRRVVLEATPGSRISPAAAIPQSCLGLYDTYLDESAALFKAAMDRGLLRKANAIYVALTLEGAINAFEAFWDRRGMTLPVTEQARLVRQHFLTPLELRKGER